ncbi:MAG: hypothetical protein LUH07_10435, partial [Lachnospiraceae bacterium]|nr:hypothetical protein [Lachnospiraceae bacterium]
MKKRNCSKVLSVILASVMLTGAFSAVAFAEETELVTEAATAEVETEEEITCIGEHYTIEVNGVSLYY